MREQLSQAAFHLLGSFVEWVLSKVDVGDAEMLAVAELRAAEIA